MTLYTSILYISTAREVSHGLILYVIEIFTIFENSKPANHRLQKFHKFFFIFLV